MANLSLNTKSGIVLRKLFCDYIDLTIFNTLPDKQPQATYRMVILNKMNGKIINYGGILLYDISVPLSWMQLFTFVDPELLIQCEVIIGKCYENISPLWQIDLYQNNIG